MDHVNVSSLGGTVEFIDARGDRVSVPMSDIVVRIGEERAADLVRALEHVRDGAVQIRMSAAVAGEAFEEFGVELGLWHGNAGGKTRIPVLDEMQFRSPLDYDIAAMLKDVPSLRAESTAPSSRARSNSRNSHARALARRARRAPVQHASRVANRKG